MPTNDQKLGTDEGSYWPSPELISGLIEKHTNPVLKFLSLSHTLPEKTTAKTIGSSLLNHISHLPFYLGVALFILVGGILGTSYLLGYDNVWGRFKTWVTRLQRRLNDHRKHYIGLRTSDTAASSGRSSLFGGRAGEAAAATANEEELGLDDFVEDEDDDGASFSYR
ncbi:hypothetical protein BC830DRAFT_1191954 [Chytriomyces sp. MP71]|nr:hypothetical protein BC830DRAFT_1191954 [Chytriomyces sp. MP71]